MNRPATDLVSIVIPTLEREKPLRRALASARGQVLPDDLAIEIIVVDNSKSGSARWVEHEAGNGGAVRYAAEPVPGVANARNAGILAASGRWVAFLDDDEEAAPDWIARHIAALRKTGADASFGPVTARAEEGGIAPRFAAFFSRRIDRPDRSDIGDLSAFLGTNNSVFRRENCLDAAAPFDIALNETGGEDSLLLAQLAGAGRRFVWAADAGVIEWVPARRLTWAYVRRRRFLSGQIRNLVQHRLSPPRHGKILLWMAAGAVQAVLWSTLSLLARPFDSERAEEARSKAWGGLGKLFWGRRFGPKLYGSGLVS